MTWFILAHALGWLGMIAGAAALLCYIASVHETDKAHLRRLRADAFARAQRSISHRGRA